MARARTEPWASFAAWLIEDRDVTRQTAANYVSLVRRIMRNVETLSPDNLAAYVNGHPTPHRSPLRSAWRRFVEWSGQRTPAISVPTFPTVAVESLPVAVQAAIRVIRQDGVPAKVMQQLTWDIDDDPILASLATENEKTWLRPPAGMKCDALPISPSALKVLQDWGYPNVAPSTQDPVVPRGPYDPKPMPLATIRRVLRGETRT